MVVILMLMVVVALLAVDEHGGDEGNGDAEAGVQQRLTRHQTPSTRATARSSSCRNALSGARLSQFPAMNFLMSEAVNVPSAAFAGGKGVQ